MANIVSLTKTVTAIDGSPVDLAAVKQNDRLVVHLAGRSEDDAYHQAILVDMLPAGWEIEAVVPRSAKDNGNGFPWLGQISSTNYAQKRDDRLVAAFDLGVKVKNRFRFADDDEDQDNSDPKTFNIAYIVRAVTPVSSCCGRRAAGHVSGARDGANVGGRAYGDWQAVKRAALFAVIVAAALAALAITLDRLFPPDLSRYLQASTEVTARDGALLRAFTTRQGTWRLRTAPADVEPRTIALLLAAEDKRFASHPGIDPLALLRAAGQLLRSGISSPAVRPSPCRSPGCWSRIAAASPASCTTSCARFSSNGVIPRTTSWRCT